MGRHLTKTERKEINRLYWEENISPKKIADLFPINFNHVQRVCYEGKPKGIYTPSFKASARKLNEIQVMDILIERMKYGTTYKDIGEKYGVTAAAISLICRGVNWKHIFQKATKQYKQEILRLV